MWRRFPALVGFSALFFAASLRADSPASDTLTPLRFDLRYHAAPNRRNTLDQTGTLVVPLLSHLDLRLGARLAESSSDLEAFSYKAEGAWSPVSFLTVLLRLYHELDLPDTTTETDVLPAVRIAVSPFSFLGVFATCGWYFRFTQLTGAVVLPTPWRSQASEHDFALEFGFEIRPTQDWVGVVEMATFETLTVFNLNNPFFEASAEYRPAGLPFSALVYGRYQVLLGFGRLDDLMMGVGLKLPLLP